MWEATAAELVALLRSAVAPTSTTHGWPARHDLRRHPGGGVYRLRHPQVGDLALRYDKSTVADAEGQVLVVYQAEPGSRSAEALSLLASLSDATAAEVSRR